MRNLIITVFVNSIVQQAGQSTTVRASNGSPDGPPLLVFKTTQPEDFRIGQRITLTAEVES